MEHFSKVLAIVRAFKVQVLNRVRWLWEDLPDGYDSFWLLDIYLAVAGKSNETITDHAFCLCSQLPHSGDHHADYVDVRATLMVVGYFCRHGMSFQCAGIGDISSAVFADLVNISYSVLTFLLNVL
ncbi:hypothetical protein pipiens_005510 [Culex pipiens pipiens]|uniref:Uncharacterized protein n=1 Tax=Culex pipiens pipiens TaxID=38569 RepID=A0ABD1DW25_CULPP